MEEIIIYKGIEVEIWRDNFPSNPFEEWDCEYPLMSTHKDYSEGGINSYLSEVLTDGQIIRHQKVLCEALEICLNEYTPKDEKICYIREEIGSTSSYEGLSKVCELSKTPYYTSTSRGYSQSDWSNIFICWTTDFENLTGTSKKQATEESLESTFNLFGYWAWGDVYGYTIEENNDSCGGFYGDDHKESGLLEHVKESVDYCLSQKLKKKTDKLKHLIKHKVPYEIRVKILKNY